MAMTGLAPSAYGRDEAGVYLVGSRCRVCATATFPAASGCPQCGAQDVAEEVLPRVGRLWSWTSQAVRPKSPPYAGAESVQDYRPFLVGYLQFPDGLCVEGRLTGVTQDQVRIGTAMRLVEEAYAVDASGAVRNGYAFAPATEEAS
jgi:uncharacterized OB-fold protein